MDGLNDLGALSEYQYGVVSRKQVLDALGHRSSLASALEQGDLKKVHEFAYRLRGVADIWERSAMEAQLIGGDDSALSHETAAWLHGLDGFKKPKIIDVTSPRDIVREHDGVRFHRPRNGPGARVYCRLLPTTTVQRTIVDLAGQLAEAPLEFALDSAYRRYKKFPEWLENYALRLRPQCTPGLATLLRLLALRQGMITDSPFEVRVLRKLRAHGLIPDEEPVEVYDRDRNYVMRLDFAWEALKVALHVDSYLWHQQRERFDRDARQRSRLTALGWQSITVTWTNFEDGAWLSDLQSLVAPQGEFVFH
jgi:hypothetical protein